MTGAPPAGETDLARLLATTRVSVAPETYVFATTTEQVNIAALAPRMVFEEAEGTTLVVAEEVARRHRLPATFPSRMLTLDVHSALAAVGYMAAISRVLADAGIPSNPVAGYFHDHLFIPLDRMDDAVRVIEALAASAPSSD
ncbi:MAG: ACT domain-containing protein [Pseudomonadota bacterium]